MTKYKINKAFSMVEMMLLLVIASLIVAASVPIITKKHIHLPSLANHGTYACYYKDGHLWEIRKSGRGDQKVLSGYPRETTNCVFEPPAKAMMFQITAIGGGGGGGDAGYTGSMPSTYENTESEFLPFDLDYDDLIAIGVDNSNDAFKEVEDYMGQIWGFAQAADSGKAGDIDYADIVVTYEDFPCPKNKKKYKYEPVTTTIGPVTLCDGTQAGIKEVYYCYAQGDSNQSGSVVGGYVTYESKTAQCTRTTTKCISQTEECDKDVVDHYYTEYEYNDNYISSYIEPVEIPCTNPCQYLGQTNCNSGKCYTKREAVYTACVCPDGDCPDACIKSTTSTPIYKTVKDICEKPCEDTEIVEPYEDKAPESATWGEGNTGNCKKQSNVNSNIEVSYTKKVEDGCQIDTNYASSVSYEKKTHKSNYSAGKSLFCVTGQINGKIGLSYTESTNIYKLSANDGEHINKNHGIPNDSFCDGVGWCGPSIGEHYSESNSFTITSGDNTYSAESTSAPEGATGDKLKRTSQTIEKYTGSDDDNINTETVTYYYDEVLDNNGNPIIPGKNGTNGICTSGTENNSLDCRTDKTMRTGYCLQHYGKSDADLGGVYSYQYTSESNSLSKGLPGEAGEFKTTIVRSLSGMDTTINIGRGGSGATVNLGKQGSKGSATTFGTILRAEGGNGGVGSQPAPKADGQLPKFDKNVMNFTKLKACFTTTTYDEDNECIGWKNNPNAIEWYRNTSEDTSEDKGNSPQIKTVGGMFNFIIASFGISNDDTIKDIMNYAGRGGNGGGVEHFCWAGQYILTFEGQELYKTSVYRESNVPQGKGVPDNHIIPDGSSDKGNCYTSYRNIPAGSGYDGALIITW